MKNSYSRIAICSNGISAWRVARYGAPWYNGPSAPNGTIVRKGEKMKDPEIKESRKSSNWMLKAEERIAGK